MHFKKTVAKTISLCFTFCFLFCFGCSPDQNSSSPSSFKIVSDSPSSISSKEKATVTCYPSTMQPDENTLNFLLINNTKIQLNDGTIADFNKLLSDKGIDYQVRFIAITSRSSDDAVEIALKAYKENYAEKADLINAANTSESLIADGTFFPLNDWIDENGGFLKEVLAWKNDWYRATKEGTVYGIPNLNMYAVGPAWQIKGEVFEEFSIPKESFQKELWDLKEVFANIFEKNFNKPFLMCRNGASGFGSPGKALISVPAQLSYLQYRYDFLCSAAAIDWQKPDTPIVNVYEEKYLEKTILAWQEYYQKGYLSSEEDVFPLVQPGAAYSLTPAELDNGGDMPEILVPISKTYISNLFLLPDSFIGISANSNKKDKALDFLKQVYTNKELYNTLVYGVEDKDYIVKDGFMADGPERFYLGKEMLYGYEYAPFKIWENSFLIPKRAGMSTKEAHLQDLENAVFTPYPQISWDFTHVKNEFDRCEALIQQYSMKFSENLENGTVMQQLTSLRASLKDAGIDRIIEDLNRQAQDWREKNP